MILCGVDVLSQLISIEFTALHSFREGAVLESNLAKMLRLVQKRKQYVNHLEMKVYLLPVCI